LPPLAGVREIPLIVSAKDKTEVPGGGADGTAESVKLTVASPVVQLTVQPPVPAGGPLQAAKVHEVISTTRSRVLLRFIWHSTLDLSALAILGREYETGIRAKIPKLNVARLNTGRTAKSGEVFNC
jgi:hypothetical protein